MHSTGCHETVMEEEEDGVAVMEAGGVDGAGKIIKSRLRYSVSIYSGAPALDTLETGSVPN